MPSARKDIKKPARNGRQLVIKDERGRFMPGSVPNPNGRPVGKRDFFTDFKAAIAHIKDESTGETMTETHIIRIGLEKMLKGEARFEPLYQDLMDRVYGKAQQSLALTDTDGNALPITNFVITPIEDDKPATGKNG